MVVCDFYELSFGDGRVGWLIEGGGVSRTIHNMLLFIV